MANDQEKVLAARTSMQFVEDGQVVGLGSGSTAAYAVQLLGERVRAGLKIHGIPTSVQTQQLAEELRIPLLALNDVQEIDLTVDGADEIDPELRLIKGGGGALLREKLVAHSSRRVVIIADEGKRVPRLGTRWRVPVEIVPFGAPQTLARIQTLFPGTVLR